MISLNLCYSFTCMKTNAKERREKALTTPAAAVEEVVVSSLVSDLLFSGRRGASSERLLEKYISLKT